MLYSGVGGSSHAVWLQTLRYRSPKTVDYIHRPSAILAKGRKHSKAPILPQIASSALGLQRNNRILGILLEPLLLRHHLLHIPRRHNKPALQKLGRRTSKPDGKPARQGLIIPRDGEDVILHFKQLLDGRRENEARIKAMHANGHALQALQLCLQALHNAGKGQLAGRVGALAGEVVVGGAGGDVEDDLLAGGRLGGGRVLDNAGQRGEGDDGGFRSEEGADQVKVAEDVGLEALGVVALGRIERGLARCAVDGAGG